MKKLKTQKGITLIALIITIVVLLILAVVAIGETQDSDIVGYAQNAVAQYDNGTNNEISLLEQYEQKIEDIIGAKKDRTFVYETAAGRLYISVTKDNKIYFVSSEDGVLGEPYDFRYVNVTKEIIQSVDSSGTIPNDINHYSCALECTQKNSDDKFYLLLTKDEKSLYYVNLKLSLTDKTIELDNNEDVMSLQTKIYEMKGYNNGSEIITFTIIKSNELQKIIMIQDGKIIYETEEEQIEIKENYTIKVGDTTIGNYKYVVVEKNASQSEIDGGVKAKISDNGKEHYSLMWQTGENNELIMHNWVGPSTLNENLTEEMIYQQYPKAQ